MKRLSHKQLDALLAELTNAAAEGPHAFNAFASTYPYDARLEFPLGELTNPKIAGFVWAWGMKRVIYNERIRKGDRFNAQGLEGKAVVNTTFITALLVCQELPRYRCNVYAPKEATQ